MSPLEGGLPSGRVISERCDGLQLAGDEAERDGAGPDLGSCANHRFKVWPPNSSPKLP